jgi:hypothetical protein
MVGPPAVKVEPDTASRQRIDLAISTVLGNTGHLQAGQRLHIADEVPSDVATITILYSG